MLVLYCQVAVNILYSVYKPLLAIEHSRRLSEKDSSFFKSLRKVYCVQAEYIVNIGYSRNYSKAHSSNTLLASRKFSTANYFVAEFFG